jgi:hypothetical protein
MKSVLFISVVWLLLWSGRGLAQCPTPYNPFTNEIENVHRASVTWRSEQPASYEVRWRVLTTPGWFTATTGSTTLLLTGLTADTPYEWQVRANCAGAFSAWTGIGPATTFRTRVCEAPYDLALGGTAEDRSIPIQWGATPGLTSFALDVQPTGATAWTTLSGLSSTFYNLTGLNPATNYTVRVRSNCLGNNTSPNSETATFQTTGDTNPVVCPPLEDPTVFFDAQNPPPWLALWVRGTGTYPGGTTYTLRWRDVSAPTWTDVPGLTDTRFQFPSLDVFTTYEFEVKAVCGAGHETPYTPTYRFPKCLQPSLPTVQQDAYPDQARVFTQGSLAPRTIDLQWRAVGAANWNTLPGLPAQTGQYSLTTLSPNIPYEVRYRTQCSATDTSPYSDTAPMQVRCPAPPTLFLDNITATTVRLTGHRNAATLPGQTVSVRYRAEGATAWTELTDPPSPVTLTGLLAGTTYEVQARTHCTTTDLSAYTSVRFRTVCPVPLLPSNQGTSFTSANLRWFTSAGEATGSVVRYRAVGAQGWQVLTVPLVDPETQTFSLTGLPNNTAFEWQVQQTCSATERSAFTNTQTFTTTNLCPVPFLPQTGSITGTSASLGWQGNTLLRQADVRWRVVGTPTFTTQSGITAPPYLLTGLSTTTQYEWQARNVCTAQLTSAFASLLTFTTTNTPGCTSMNTVQAGPWNAPATWSCNRLPLSTETVLVSHALTIPASYTAQVRQVRYQPNGRITLGANARIQLMP